MHLRILNSATTYDNIVHVTHTIDIVIASLRAVRKMAFG
jgi:hypothetical protein